MKVIVDGSLNLPDVYLRCRTGILGFAGTAAAAGEGEVLIRRQVERAGSAVSVASFRAQHCLTLPFSPRGSTTPANTALHRVHVPLAGPTWAFASTKNYKLTPESQTRNGRERASLRRM